MEFPDNGYGPHGTRIGRTLIVGGPGSGKTTLAAPLVRFVCPDSSRIRCVGPVPKLAVALGVPYIDLPTSDRAAQERFFRKEYEEARKQYPDGERLIVVDEADQYFSQTGRTYNTDALREVCNVGRNFLISQIYISRSPLDVSRNTRGLFNVLFIGRNTEPRAAEWWEDFTGIEGFAVVLRDLQEYRFIVYATDRVPHVLGVAWAENGQIQTSDWKPQPEQEPEENPDGSETSENLEADGTAATVDTPGAERPSPTPGGADTVPTTPPKGGGSPTG